MPTIHVRRATPQDAAAISRWNAAVQNAHAAVWPKIFKLASPDSFPVDQFHGWSVADPDDHFFFVACLDDEPAGYAYAQVLRRPESGFHHAAVRLHLHHLAVDPERRRCGCGRALLQTIIATARELSIDAVTLDVWSFNAEAKAFYEAVGFAVYNEAMRFDLPARE